MAPFALNLEKSRSQTNTVELEPALSAFVSALLVAKDDTEPGIHEWVRRTQMAMTPEELGRHRLVMIGLYYAVVPRNRWPTIPAFLAELEQQPPSVFRENLLESYAGIFAEDCTPEQHVEVVQWDEVLSSPASYVAFLKNRFTEAHVDVEIETRAYQYVLDPAAMKQLIVDHLRWFWKNHLEAEWKRVEPMLEESVKAFQRVGLNEMSRLEAARFVTGQDLEEDKWGHGLEDAENMVLIPNAHIGPYLQRSVFGDTVYIFFGARQPEGDGVRVPELDRAEIVSRLSALADETRLQILQMVIENGEMRSQDIIDATGLSQPSVSRYLTQLTAAGYLLERRSNGAKVYSLHRDRVEKTLRAVSAFLLDRS
jgi:DNA-binding transcriptional ArsR family regulator